MKMQIGTSSTADFKDFNDKLEAHVAEMIQGGKPLFIVDLDKEAVWETYMDSFPPGTNELYRKARYYECSHCRHFLYRYAGLVTVGDDWQLHSIWDFDTGSDVFQPVVDALARLVKSSAIKQRFFAASQHLGLDHNIQLLDDGGTIRWDHLYLKVPQVYVVRYRRNDKITEARHNKEGLERSLNEITAGAIQSVLDMIAEGVVPRGNAIRYALEKFAEVWREYEQVQPNLRDNWLWQKSTQLPRDICRIHSTSYGQLLRDISAGEDVQVALRKYSDMVDSTVYQRPTVTRDVGASAIRQAQEAIEELGYANSFERRFALIGDVTVNNTIYSDPKARSVMADGNSDKSAIDVLGSLAKSAQKIDPNKFKNVQPVHIDDFIRDILPTTESLELLLEQRLHNNAVSLLAPVHKDAPSPFKWENNFTWAYTGNLAAKSTKELVEEHGGKTSGVLRFSIRWNDPGKKNLSDLDAHCVEYNGDHIYYQHKVSQATGGNLDVDIINPTGTAVENIIYPSLRRMKDGNYKFYVHCFTKRSATAGFTAEIEFDGRIYRYECAMPLSNGQNVDVATVTLQNGKFTIKHHLQPREGLTGGSVWGLEYNKFHPVSLVCLSPNCWDGKQVGEKHFMFMLPGMVNNENPSGFFNEFLSSRLRGIRKVSAILADKMRVQNADKDQLSGLGFPESQRQFVYARVNGERVVKIVF